MAPICSNLCAYMGGSRLRDMGSQERRSYVKTEAETGVRLLQAKEPQE